MATWMTTSAMHFGGAAGSAGTAGVAAAAAPNTLTSTATISGPNLCIQLTTLSATPLVLPVPGATSLAGAYIPFVACSLMGLTAQHNGANQCSLELYDQTASKSIVSMTIPATSNYTSGAFTLTQYPMTAGNTHVWRVTGSGTSTLQISPFYTGLSSSSSNAVSMVPGFTSGNNVAWTATAQNLLIFGNTASTRTRGWEAIKATSVFGFTGSYNPSVAGAAAASVTVTVFYYNVSAGTSTTITTLVLSNTGLPATFGPYVPNSSVVPASCQVYMTATGTGTGTVNVDMSVLM